MALVGLGLGTGFGSFEGLRFGPPLVMLALGGMTLALCGIALWRVVDPLTRPDAGLVVDGRRPGRARELEREKQAVLKAIKEIELDYQMRKIADGDYRDMIERYRGRAMRLIAEVEAGDNFRELIERELKDRLAAQLATGTPTAGDETGAGDVAPAAVATIAAAPVPVVAVTSTGAATAAGTSCRACGGINDSDAQFCKKCGVKLVS